MHPSFPELVCMPLKQLLKVDLTPFLGLPFFQVQKNKGNAAVI
jgi:hypothetical protein